MQEEKKSYAGKDLLMFGHTGAEGTVQIVEAGRASLAKTLPADFLDEVAAWTWEAAPVCDWEELGVQKVWPVGEGGLFAALWYMAQETGTGFRIDLKQLPIRQETIEVCEVFDLNPYQLRSGGCYLAAAANGNDVLWQCRQKGVSAALIGKLSGDHDKAIYNGENIRYLDRPKPDELVRFREMMAKEGEE